MEPSTGHRWSRQAESVGAWMPEAALDRGGTVAGIERQYPCAFGLAQPRHVCTQSPLSTPPGRSAARRRAETKVWNLGRQDNRQAGTPGHQAARHASLDLPPLPPTPTSTSTSTSISTPQGLTNYSHSPHRVNSHPRHASRRPLLLLPRLPSFLSVALPLPTLAYRNHGLRRLFRPELYPELAASFTLSAARTRLPFSAILAGFISDWVS
ncbi:hypothetical protein LTR28_011033 [Elasticomyces elasticus]|nr:hypothetical protein LTR28_011033 [Elasticomyces elasticus]